MSTEAENVSTPRTYPAELRAQIVAEVLQGGSQTDLARQHNIPPQTVFTWVTKARAKLHGQPQRHAPDPAAPAWQPISRNDPRPKHQQVSDRLRTAIATGALKSDELLPSHRHMTQLFRVSLVSLRKALQDLEHEGFVTTCQGVGTFVTSPSQPNRRNPLIKFEVTHQSGGQFTIVMNEHCTPIDVRDLCLRLLMFISDLPTTPPKVIRRPTDNNPGCRAMDSDQTGLVQAYDCCDEAAYARDES
jgi:DNA-binding transcriptional regulator YhcF (GntR family)